MRVIAGRVWAGHNIGRFDCARIREAFAEIGRPAPEAKGMIDTLPLLTRAFGRRAGDMKVNIFCRNFVNFLCRVVNFEFELKFFWL